MSATESKVKNTRKSSRAKSEKTQATSELVTVLDNTDVRYAAFTDLYIGELNARLIPHTDEEIQGYADSIEGVGLLQNLVVVEGDDGRLEVVCGGGRTRAIGLLVEAGKVDPAKTWIPFKAVPRELARAASLTENGQHKRMHPAEQIVGFRNMSAEGQTPAQIGAMLGYGAAHVQRMLKLANLAPDIIDALAKDELTTEHCHALALDADHDRQREVLEAGKKEAYGPMPSASLLRRLMTSGEVSTSGNSKFAFVGGEAAFADGDIRRDLFSDEAGGFVDAVKLDTLFMAKLEQLAETLKTDEGWTWCEVRKERLYRYGDDQQQYVMADDPAPVLTEDECVQMDALHTQMENLQPYSEEYRQHKAEVDRLNAGGVVRAWAGEDKSGRGVVVSWHQGEPCIQRGVVKKTGAQQEEEAAQREAEKQASAKPVDAISAPLLKKMSSERTLAVQAALMQQREKAVALLAWRMCASVFHYCLTTRHPFVISPQVNSALTSDAPSGESGTAWLALKQEEERLRALLPENWKKDFTTFFTLDVDTLLDLMAFCTARTVDGAQSRVEKHTPASDLDGVEEAIGFDLRDWWQPTADHFFMSLKTPQIIAALNEAGLTGAASDAAKMKKRDAADHAAFHLNAARWVPEWMQSPRAAASAKADTATVTDIATPHPDADNSSDHSPAAAA